MNTIFSNGQSRDELLSNPDNIGQLFFVVTPLNDAGPGNRLATLVEYKGNNEFIYYSPDHNNNSDNLHTIDPVPLAQIGPNNAEQSVFFRINVPLEIFAKIQNYGTQLGGKKLKKSRKSKKPKKLKKSLKFIKLGK